MRVLVTGGAGFIGSHVVRALVTRGDAVRVLDDLSSGRRANLDGVDAELVVGDITEPDVVRSALAGITHVIHLAALVSVPRSIAEPELSHAVNATGTLRLLVAARDHDVRRVVIASSSAVYGDTDGVNDESMALHPTSPYGVDKMAAEAYATTFHRLYGLETVSLRYFNVFGPRQDPASGYAAAVPRFVARLLAGRPPIIFGDGTQTRDFTYVANVVQANLLALQAPAAPGGTFNVATGVSVSVATLAADLADVTGRPDLRAEHAAPRAGDILHSSADVTRARESLGFRPEVDLREGLRRTVEWYRAADLPVIP